MTWETMIRKGARALAFVAVALAAAACGVKSSPHMPEDSVYPRQYPAPAGKASPETGTKETGTKKTSRHPLGFPYEYPNRPPAR